MNNIELAQSLDFMKNKNGTAIFRYAGGNVAYVTDLRGSVLTDINLGLFSNDALQSIVGGMGFITK